MSNGSWSEISHLREWVGCSPGTWVTWHRLDDLNCCRLIEKAKQWYTSPLQAFGYCGAVLLFVPM